MSEPFGEMSLASPRDRPTRRPKLMRPLSPLLLVGLCVHASPKVASAQQAPDAFRTWASTRAIPVRTTDLDTTARDLLPLRQIVGQARVVAYGEPTHGAHEPLAFRNRL